MLLDRIVILGCKDADERTDEFLIWIRKKLDSKVACFINIPERGEIVFPDQVGLAKFSLVEQPD